MTQATEISPTQKINELNMRILKGELVSDDELKEAIRLLRETRGKKVEASPTAKKGKAVPIDLNSLFG